MMSPAESHAPHAGAPRRARLAAASAALASLLAAASAPAAGETPSTTWHLTPVADPVLAALQRTYFGAAWGDADGDGRPDLALAALDPGPGTLLRNTAAGFVEVSAGPVTADNAQRAGVAWGDLDGDGLLDLFTVNAYGETDFLYRNLGSLSFAPLSGPATTTSGLGISAVWVDFNRDGRLDLFVTNGGGSGEQADFLYRNVGDGRLEPVTGDPVVDEVRYSHGAAFADYTGDGWPDLVVAHAYGPPSFFRNRGDGTFAALAGTPEAPDPLPPSGTIPVWADFDADGDFDLLLPTGQTPHAYFRNDGGRLVTATLSPVTDAAGPVAGGVAADFDNDGWLDVVLASRDGAHQLFRGTGPGTFQPLPLGELGPAPAPANGLAVADYDLDGDLDLLFAHWPAAGVTLYRNDTSTHHWLRVRAVAADGNRNALGARIVAVTRAADGTESRQVRQIGGFDSAGSEEYLAHFGLGPNTTVSELRVEFPSGSVHVQGNVAADQVLTVAEGPFESLGAPTLNRQTGLVEHRVRFNPVFFRPPNQVRIVVTNLPAGTRWNEATGTNALGPYLDLRPSPTPGVPVTLAFTFFQPARSPLPIPAYHAEFGAWSEPIPEAGPLLAVERTVTLPDGRVLIEFTSRPATRYAIETSPDLAVWSRAPGSLVAGGTRTQWIDDGPPSTPSRPSADAARFYRIVQLP